MKYLVTGGAGFIGSYLCESLIRDGHRVYCMDNLIWGKIRNISHLMTDPNFLFSTKIKEIPYDGIFHLASPVTSKLCEENQAHALNANLEMTKELIVIGSKYDCPILFASTIKAKGEANGDYYVEIKKEAEKLLLCYKKAKIARMGNVYGPRMSKDDPRVIPTFFRSAPRITIYGDGSQLDSFCWIEDMVEALRKFMDSDYYGILELGNDQTISILELAKLICGDKIKLKFVDKKFSDSKIPDISLAKKILGWEPKTKIEDGIKKIKEIKN